MNINPVLAFLFFCVLQANAQDYVVVRCKPPVKLFEKGKFAGNLLPGKVLQSSDAVELIPGGCVYLSNEAHQVKLFDRPGRFTYGDIREAFEKETGLFKQLIRYFGVEATTHEESLRAHALQHMSAVKAGPARDVMCRMQYPPDGIVLMTDTVRFRLNEHIAGNAESRLVVYANDTLHPLIDTVFKKEMLLRFRRKQAETLLWQSPVKSKPLSSVPVFRLTFAGDSLRKHIARSEKKINRISHNNEERRLLLLAGLYEDNRLFYEADTAYTLLCRKYPSADYATLQKWFRASFQLVEAE